MLMSKITVAPPACLIWTIDHESVFGPFTLFFFFLVVVSTRLSRPDMTRHLSCKTLHEIVFTAEATPFIGAGSQWDEHSSIYTMFLFCSCFFATSIVTWCKWCPLPELAQYCIQLGCVWIPMCSLNYVDSPNVLLWTEIRKQLGIWQHVFGRDSL